MWANLAIFQRAWRDLLVLLLAIGVVLIAARAALPFVVEDYVNDHLQSLEAYDGSVQDVDIALLRGAYRIDGIEPRLAVGLPLGMARRPGGEVIFRVSRSDSEVSELRRRPSGK